MTSSGLGGHAAGLMADGGLWLDADTGRFWLLLSLSWINRLNCSAFAREIKSSLALAISLDECSSTASSRRGRNVDLVGRTALSAINGMPREATEEKDECLDNESVDAFSMVRNNSEGPATEGVLEDIGLGAAELEVKLPSCQKPGGAVTIPAAMALLNARLGSP
jgi:hypothetical protein